MTTHDWFTFGLTVVVGLLAWLFHGKFDDIDKDRAEFVKHMKDTDVHETDRDREGRSREIQAITSELIRHSMRDDQRFDSFDEKLQSIGNDIKTLLRAAGKA